MKTKFTTILIIIATLVLAGVAIFTAIRLFQLRGEPVAPTAPTSQPEAAGNCSLAFTISTATATATATATSTATSTATATATATSTATSTATATATATPNVCNGACSSNAGCAGDMICYQGYCRDAACVAETDCSCNGATQTPAPTEASLPNSGTEWPTIFGTGIGIIVILSSLLLAL